MRKYKKRMVIVLAVVLLLVVAGATVAFTQDPEPGVQSAEQAPGDRPVRNPIARKLRQVRIERRLHQLVTQALADELEISVDELRVARQASWIMAIEQIQAEGLISDDRAELMLARITIAGYLQPDEVVAGILGITVEELAEARAEGKTIREIAIEQNLDWPTIRDNIHAAREETIQQALEDGIITAEQAQLLLNSPPPNLDRRPPHRPFR